MSFTQSDGFIKAQEEISLIRQMRTAILVALQQITAGDVNEMISVYMLERLIQNSTDLAYRSALSFVDSGKYVVFRAPTASATGYSLTPKGVLTAEKALLEPYAPAEEGFAPLAEITHWNFSISS